MRNNGQNSGFATGLTHQNSPGFEPVHSADSRFSTLRGAGVCGYSSLYIKFWLIRLSSG